MDNEQNTGMDENISRGDFLYLAVDRIDVELCNIFPVLHELYIYIIRKNVRKYKHRMTIAFSGYEEDPREVFEIEEIRQYVATLSEKFSYWFYFLNIEDGTLNTIAGCLCRSKQVNQDQMEFNREDLRNFYLGQLDMCRILSKNAPFTEEEARDLEREINLYYLGIPEVSEEYIDNMKCENAIANCKQGRVTEDTVRILHRFEKENDDCLVCLCDCYYYGYGVERDYEKAVQYALAANQKEVFMGMIYCSEWGERLRRVFSDAENGDAEAQYKLGISYWYGCGVDKDTEKATIWMKKAAKQGHDEATKFIVDHGTLE